MADNNIRVEAILCPDEVLKDKEPDPSWPRCPGLRVLFRRGKVAAGEATTNANGLATHTALASGSYDMAIDGGTAPAKYSADPLHVAAAQARKQQRITLIPEGGHRLLPLLLCGEEPGGKKTALHDAKVTMEALDEADWRDTFPATGDGHVYALVPHTDANGKKIRSVKLKFLGTGHFEPKYREVTFGIPEPDDPLVEQPTFLYQRITPRREQFHGISVRPTIIDLSGNEVPLIGAKVIVKPQRGSSRAAEHVRTLDDEQGNEVRFPNLESGVYFLTVIPPKILNGWPIKAESKEVGPHYLRAAEHFEADVEPFGFEQINMLIKTPDDRPLDHEVQLVIFGPDGSVEVTAKSGKFSVAAPSEFPLKIMLASGAAPAIGGVPLELQAPELEVKHPPDVTEVNLQYRHAVTGRAVDESGRPMPGAVIVLYDGAQEAARAVADNDGNFVAGLKKAGSYSIAIQTEGGQPVTQRLLSVSSTLHVGDVAFVRWPSPDRDDSPRDGDRRDRDSDDLIEDRPPREAITDLASYPVLTEEVSTTGPPAPAGGAPGTGGAGAGYGQTVDQVMRDVLGWRPSGDVAGFQTALTGAFQLRQAEGHTEWTWQQRGYAVQADMGALTGAQASIYARAKAALDQILPLLAGVTALNPNIFPPEDLEAIRSVIAAEVQELVDELALEGGPRIQRVDQLFRLLVGESSKSRDPNPDHVQGQLGTMRARFGLTEEWVDTIDEERILTNFRVVVEQVLSLQESWFYDRKLLSVVDAQSSLGTILIWLSRGLEAVCESVDDLTFSLDSVYVDAAQRQVIELTFRHQAPMLLSDLLDWIVRAARDEGPRLIQDAGRDGVDAFAPVLQELRTLVQDSRTLIRKPGAALPDGMRTPRVHRAFQVLEAQLTEATRLAGLVQKQPYAQAPEISSAHVKRLSTGQEIKVEMTGVNFRKHASAFLLPANREDIPDLHARAPRVHDASRASATFRIPSQWAHVSWQVVIANDDGTQSDPVDITMPAGFGSKP